MRRLIVCMISVACCCAMGNDLHAETLVPSGFWVSKFFQGTTSPFFDSTNDGSATGIAGMAIDADGLGILINSYDGLHRIPRLGEAPRKLWDSGGSSTGEVVVVPGDAPDDVHYFVASHNKGLIEVDSNGKELHNFGYLGLTDPSGLEFLPGGFGAGLAVMFFEGASPHYPTLKRFDPQAAPNEVTLAVFDQWGMDTSPADLAVLPFNAAETGLHAPGFLPGLYTTDGYTDSAAGGKVYFVPEPENGGTAVPQLFSQFPVGGRPQGPAFSPGGRFGAGLFVVDTTDSGPSIYRLQSDGSREKFAELGIEVFTQHTYRGAGDILFLNRKTLLVGTEDALLAITADTGLGDADGDFDVDLGDFGLLKGVFGSQDPRADWNHDSQVDLADFGILKVNFGRSGAAVPEPRTLDLMLAASAILGGLSLARSSRWRSRHCQSASISSGRYTLVHNV